MSVLWVVTVLSLLLALAAWMKARRTARRLEQLTQMYWELKYQHGELRVHVQRLSGDGPPPETPQAPRPPVEAFVPLTSLKR